MTPFDLAAVKCHERPGKVSEELFKTNDNDAFSTRFDSLLIAETSSSFVPQWVLTPPFWSNSPRSYTYEPRKKVSSSSPSPFQPRERGGPASSPISSPPSLELKRTHVDVVDVVTSSIDGGSLGGRRKPGSGDLRERDESKERGSVRKREERRKETKAHPHLSQSLGLGLELFPVDTLSLSVPFEVLDHGEVGRVRGDLGL